MWQQQPKTLATQRCKDQTIEAITEKKKEKDGRGEHLKAGPRRVVADEG
jgi:hypothetical protein